VKYEVALVNPKTNRTRKIVVSAEPPSATEDLQNYVQTLARPNIPEGFMCLGGGVRPLLQ